MIPPSYVNIGREASDLFSKDYPTGSTKLEVSTTTNNGIKFTVTGNKDNKSGAISSDVKAKFTDKSRGLTFTESWTTSNVLVAQLELADTIQGLKFDLAASLLPEKGTKHAKAGIEYKQEYIFTRSSLDLFKGPTLFADTVIGSNGFVAGADVSYDVSEAKVTKYGAVLGANKLTLFTASYHQKVSPLVEAGAKAIWNKAIPDSKVAIEVGTKVILDKTSFFKAKIDNQGKLGLGYTQAIQQGIKVSIGGLFDTSKLAADVHKVGMQLTFEG